MSRDTRLELDVAQLNIARECLHVRRLIRCCCDSEELCVGRSKGRTINSADRLRQENNIDCFGYLLAGLADYGLT